MDSIVNDPAGLEAAARRAAEAYGQNWLAIPAHSQDKWRAAVQAAEATPNAAGNTMLEHCAQQAYREWRKASTALHTNHTADVFPVLDTKPLAKDADRKPVVKIDPEQPKAAPKNKK